MPHSSILSKRILKHRLQLVYVVIGVLTLYKLFVYYQYYIRWGEVSFFSDDAIYATLAKRFLKGDLANAFHPVWNPGFPLASILFYSFTQSWEKAQLLVSVVSHLGLAYITFLFFKKRSLGLAILLFIITLVSSKFHNLVIFSGITEPLYIFLTFAGIFSGFKFIEEKKLNWNITQAVAFGFAYLVRTDVLGILIPFIFMTYFLGRKFKGLLIFGAVFCIIISPYVFVMSRQFSRLTFSGKYAFIGAPPPFALDKIRNTTFQQDVGSIDNINYQSIYFNPQRAKSDFIRDYAEGNGFYFAKIIFEGILRIYNSPFFFNSYEVYICVLGLLIGLATIGYRRLTLYLFLIFFVSTVWVAFFMNAVDRYVAFAFPFFFYLQGLAYWTGCVFLAKFLNKLLKQKNELLVNIIVTVFIITFYMFQNIVNVKEFYRPYKEYKIVGEWLKENNIKIISARHEALGFYSGAKTVYIPTATPEEIIKYLQDKGVEYLTIRPSDAGFPEVKPITNTEFKNPNISLVKVFNQFWEPFLIWRIDATIKK